MAINIANEAFICPVCGCKHQYRGGLLVGVTGRDGPDNADVVGYKMCETHDKQADEGMVFIVGVDMSKTDVRAPEVGPDDIVRSGSYCTLTEDMFKEMFENAPVPEGRVTYAAEAVLFSISTIVENKLRQGRKEPNVTKH